MATVIKAPDRIVKNGRLSIFLSGSIEMGAAEQWQEKFTKAVENYRIVILNPRRDDWDSSWEQVIENKKFRQQVEWELTAMIEESDAVIVYFDPKTKSPITLLELGLMVGGCVNVFCCCPKGFWRKGNVDIVCKNFHIPLFEDFDKLVLAVKKWLDEREIKKVRGA